MGGWVDEIAAKFLSLGLALRVEASTVRLRRELSRTLSRTAKPQLDIGLVGVRLVSLILN